MPQFGIAGLQAGKFFLLTERSALRRSHYRTIAGQRNQVPGRHELESDYAVSRYCSR